MRAGQQPTEVGLEVTDNPPYPLLFMSYDVTLLAYRHARSLRPISHAADHATLSRDESQAQLELFERRPKRQCDSME